MARWTVNGIDYQVAWVNPGSHKETYGGVSHLEIDPGLTVVFIADESVPKGEPLPKPPEGDPGVIAQRSQVAVGNILKSRTRIEFLRTARVFPYGMEPGATGADGGGDPRVSPNRQDKAPKRMLQPGEFPADNRIQGTTPVDAALAVAAFQAAAIADHTAAVQSGEPLRTLDLGAAPDPFLQHGGKPADIVDDETGVTIEQMHNAIRSAADPTPPPPDPEPTHPMEVEAPQSIGVGLQSTTDAAGNDGPGGRD